MATATFPAIAPDGGVDERVQRDHARAITTCVDGVRPGG